MSLNKLKELGRFPASRGAAATMDYDIVLYHAPHNGQPYIVWNELVASKAREGGCYCKSLETGRKEFVRRAHNVQGSGNLAPELREGYTPKPVEGEAEDMSQTWYCGKCKAVHVADEEVRTRKVECHYCGALNHFPDQ